MNPQTSAATGSPATSSAATSSTATSSTATSSAGTSSAGTSSAGTSSAGTSSAGTSSAGTSSTDKIVLDQVSAGTVLPPLGYDVSATTVVLGALASRDWRPMHHDHKFATERNGTADIFLNTPNLAAWFERYITDWTGPKGRIGRLTFRIRDSVFPGDHMVFAGTVSGTEIDESGCGWASVDISVTAGDRLCCTCTARVALPTDGTDNPWTRRSEDWKP